jgi:hypothetical protein
VTGPQHFAEAQRLLTVCAGDQRGSDLDKACTAAAQVHATLALAAATVCTHVLDMEMFTADRAQWLEAMRPS